MNNAHEKKNDFVHCVSAVEGRSLSYLTRSTAGSSLPRELRATTEGGLTSNTTPKLRMLVRLVVLMMLAPCRQDSAHFGLPGSRWCVPSH